MVKALAALGLALQGALPVAYLALLVAAAKTFSRVGGSSDTATAAADMTGGIAEALRYVVIGRWVALAGLPLFVLAIWRGKLRQRWIYRCAMAAFVAWVFCLGLGTIVGVTGIWVLFRHRAEFMGKADQATTADRNRIPARHPAESET